MSETEETFDLSEIGNQLPDIAIKSSFDRFGDDLTQLIFGFLSVDDKFRFECLSRRHSTLVFAKQNSLVIEFFYPEYENVTDFVLCLSDRCKHIQRSSECRDLHLSPENLVKLMKKLPNISSLTIINVTDSMLHIIADYCPSLTHLTIHQLMYNIDLSVEAIEYFGRKCGHRIRTFEFKSFEGINQLKQLLDFTPNVIRTDIRISDLIDRTEAQTPLLPRLRVISFALRVDIGGKPTLFDDLKVFQSQYCNTITRIEGLSQLFSNKKEIFEAMNIISRFHRLSSLEMEIDVEEDEYGVKDLREAFRPLADNCRQLTHLNVCLIVWNIHWITDGDIASIFEPFRQLKALSIKVQSVEVLYDEEGEEDEEEEDLMPEDKSLIVPQLGFTHLKALTHLRYLLLKLPVLLSQSLSGIEHILPHLQTLYVKRCPELSDTTLEYISRLKELRRLEILGTDDHNTITDAGVRRLLDNCSQLKKLDIITGGLKVEPVKTIEVIKVGAQGNPKANNRLDFKVSDELNEIAGQAIGGRVRYRT